MRGLPNSNDTPVSTAPFKVYNNPGRYTFTISYPSDWDVDANEVRDDLDKDAHLQDIYISYPIEQIPNGGPMQITCTANPDGLTAKQWSEQSPNAFTTPRGLKKLVSGTEVFVEDQFDTDSIDTYTPTYITARRQQVCMIETSYANPGNKKLIDKVVNSFRWLH